MIRKQIRFTNVGNRNSLFWIGVVIAVLFTAALPVRASVEFFDGDFNLADWQSTRYYWGNGGSITLSQVASGGNPGKFLEIDHYVQPAGADPSVVYGLHIPNGAAYTPSVQGEITAVDFSVNYKNLQTTAAGIGFALALRQDGNIYQVFQSLSGTIPGWQGDAGFGLQASSFGLMTPISYSFIVDFAHNPDFSASGSPIEFGLATWRASPSTMVIENVGFDNWSVTVVPEPTTFVMLALGGLLVKRRRKSA